MESGLDRFLKKDFKRFQNLRLGVLCNQASLDASLNHVSSVLIDPKNDLRLKITCFLGPQHGIRGEKQDNMIESAHFVDPKTERPVFSLYSETREPTADMLSRIDAFLIDLQDIGTRVYTFMYTLANCMRGAKKAGKKVIVLDRPNPIDGERVEGTTLEKGFTSFVGQYEIPMRHGLTMGELALLFNDVFKIGCDLEVIPVRGWKPSLGADAWKRDWVNPSPNIPTYHSALLFPATVFFEGTNVSEGRGTTRPFEWIGAPFIDPDTLAKALQKKKIPGVYFRPIYFQPTFQKWKEQVCGGVHVHVTDAKKFKSFRAGVELMNAIKTLYPKEFAWKKPPYEYEYDRMPIDLIAGTDQLRLTIDGQKKLDGTFAKAKSDSQKFIRLCKPYLLYPRKGIAL